MSIHNDIHFVLTNAGEGFRRGGSSDARAESPGWWAPMCGVLHPGLLWSGCTPRAPGRAHAMALWVAWLSSLRGKGKGTVTLRRGSRNGTAFGFLEAGVLYECRTLSTSILFFLSQHPQYRSTSVIMATIHQIQVPSYALVNTYIWGAFTWPIEHKHLQEGFSFWSPVSLFLNIMDPQIRPTVPIYSKRTLLTNLRVDVTLNRGHSYPPPPPLYVCESGLKFYINYNHFSNLRTLCSLVSF